ncbi:TPA: hypothetical protein P0E15_005057 [Vibrio harveyi]|uniref:AAA family ATPase n=1 Tax=Vibrio alginolyticus TaxID=663 RepID=UPI001110BCCF|nr:AAA family ATPase [Vibrio alginolyticus]HDM8135466.1 hypothetical protein [Vibrio harveyi]EGQ8984651.1 hypothetical protein [Vibrio alginolyticus]ELB2737662.1 hypothetical protein [Vibrio alginolyticus]ELB2758662.1 hypothetical protein [Vibrio alginolyticus]TMX48019.1 hypothetical protein DA091_24475 [Vibrio alginolyticus]
MNKVVVLFGVNGSGKSHIAKFIERKFGYKYISIEEFFMENFGDVDNYRKNSKLAWSMLKEHIKKQAQCSDICFELVFPELDNVLLDLSNTQLQYKFIKVEVSLETSLNRVRARGLNHNFPKSEDFVIETFHKFNSPSYKDFPFALKLVNEDLGEHELQESLSTVLMLENDS